MMIKYMIKTHLLILLPAQCVRENIWNVFDDYSNLYIFFYFNLTEYSQWNVTTTTAEPVRLDFDIEADLFETDDQMEEQLRKISKAFSKPSNGSGTSSNITATLLPFYFGN